jgi:hypothetical protein
VSGRDASEGGSSGRGEGVLGTGSLGAGNEAAEAMHAQQALNDGKLPEAGASASAQNDARTGRDGDRAGSESLVRNREHTPSYGGMAGVPRTSSDQREPVDPAGDQGARVASGEAPGIERAPTSPVQQHAVGGSEGGSARPEMRAGDGSVGRTSDHEGGSADAIQGDAGSQPINPT